MTRQLSAAFACLSTITLLNGCGRHQEYVSPYPTYYTADGTAYWDEAGQENYVSTVPAEEEGGYSDYSSYPSSSYDASSEDGYETSYQNLTADTEPMLRENDSAYYWGGGHGSYVSTLSEGEVYEDVAAGNDAYRNSSSSVVAVPAYSSGSSFSPPSTYAPSMSRSSFSSSSSRRTFSPPSTYAPSTSGSSSSSSSAFIRMPSPVSPEFCRSYLLHIEQQEKLRRAAAGR